MPIFLIAKFRGDISTLPKLESVPLTEANCTILWFSLQDAGPVIQSNLIPLLQKGRIMTSYQYSYVMKNLSKTFPGGKEILQGVTLSFLPDAKIGVLGVNGAGKSTLMKMMVGEVEPSGGEAWAADGVRVGYLEQEPWLDQEKTVGENVTTGLGGVTGVVGLLPSPPPHAMTLNKRMIRRLRNLINRCLNESA